MSGNPCFGYQGFRPMGQTLAPTMKPGETYELHNKKYSKMGCGVAYERGRPQYPLTMTTCSQDASLSLQWGDYRIPDRRGVSVNHSSKNPLDRSKPFLHESLYENDFRNLSKEVEQLEKHIAVGKDGGASALKKVFDGLDKGNGTIDMRDIPRVIEDALGRDVRPWIGDRILKMFENIRDGGKVSWLDLQDGLRKVGETVRAAVSYKERVVPEWVVSKRKPTVTHGEIIQSCYQKDMGKDGDIPRNRCVWYKTGMASTTMDLFEGTTKRTYHVPGYSGFIPESKSNTWARKHGDMLNPRSKRPDLLLFYRHNMPGYTGHSPAAPHNDSCPARCGSNSLTTSGAAVLGTIL